MRTIIRVFAYVRRYPLMAAAQLACAVVGTLLGIHLGTQPVTNFDEAKDANEAGLYAPFFHEMLRQGIAMAPGAYEALFPSFSHTEADIDRTVEAAGIAATAVAKTL